MTPGPRGGRTVGRCHSRHAHILPPSAPESTAERRAASPIDSRSRMRIIAALRAVANHVRSHRGTQFRQRAAERLREFLVKEFALDDERLNGLERQADCFDGRLDHIREIRMGGARTRKRPMRNAKA